MAISTWPKGITPIVHVSEPRDENNFRAHHDYVVNYIDTYGYDVDIMMEAKAKELAVLEYNKIHKTLLT
jgi:UV DNA damage endonuclease